ncbi:MAG TPA: hypothetical protein VEH55_10075 [Gaiellaceae bacterium]|nr:hypothetical protein [Gaiellaceae bacterium]
MPSPTEAARGVPWANRVVRTKRLSRRAHERSVRIVRAACC